MGGRGSASSIMSKSGNDTNNSLNADLIRHANNSSLMDMGDNINREYQRNIGEINKLNLTSKEKQDAIAKQMRLSTEALALQAKAVNPYTSGPARLTTAQKTGSAIQSVANKRAEIASHMDSLKRQSAQNNKMDSNKRLLSAMRNAIQNKQLTFVIDGKTYTRKTLRGKTFTLKG